jgi:hypothetical protein
VSCHFAQGYCYWNWGLLAREQRDRNTEREKLAAALAIFTDLKMPRERDAVRAELSTPGFWARAFMFSVRYI